MDPTESVVTRNTRTPRQGALGAMRAWPARRWAIAAAGALGTLVALGIPTVLIPNPVFTREIEPTWWSYPVWGLTAVLAGLLVAAYTTPQRARACARPAGARGWGGGVLAWLAIGCPVCNKLVLLAVGTSGALAWFAPLQPVLAVGGLVLLAAALWTRLRTTAPDPTLL